jgi:hypothetical protein
VLTLLAQYESSDCYDEDSDSSIDPELRQYLPKSIRSFKSVDSLRQLEVAKRRQEHPILSESEEETDTDGSIQLIVGQEKESFELSRSRAFNVISKQDQAHFRPFEQFMKPKQAYVLSESEENADIDNSNQLHRSPATRRKADPATAELGLSTPDRGIADSGCSIRSKDVVKREAGNITPRSVEQARNKVLDKVIETTSIRPDDGEINTVKSRIRTTDGLIEPATSRTSADDILTATRFIRAVDPENLSFPPIPRSSEWTVDHMNTEPMFLVTLRELNNSRCESDDLSFDECEILDLGERGNACRTIEGKATKEEQPIFKHFGGPGFSITQMRRPSPDCFRDSRAAYGRDIAEYCPDTMILPIRYSEKSHESNDSTRALYGNVSKETSVDETDSSKAICPQKKSKSIRWKDQEHPRSLPRDESSKESSDDDVKSSFSPGFSPGPFFDRIRDNFIDEQLRKRKKNSRKTSAGNTNLTEDSDDDVISPISLDERIRKMKRSLRKTSADRTTLTDTRSRPPEEGIEDLLQYPNLYLAQFQKMAKRSFLTTRSGITQ